MTLLIALVASLIVCVQNYMSVLGFGWALIHGAGLTSVLAFVPAVIALGTLWAGYAFISRANVPPRTAVFTLYAVVILSLNEFLLPATPLAMLWNQRAAGRVEIRSVRDELLLSDRGNPIGIRLIFDAVVPRTGHYSISPSVLSRVSDETLWPLNFGHSRPSVISPARPGSEEVYDGLAEGVVYTFTTDMMPDFLNYDDREKQPCLVNVTTKYISEDAFVAALAKSRNVKYRGEVHVSTPTAGRSAVVHHFETARGYDVEAMFRTIEVEGGRKCAQ
jgi:hypothetical protein